MKKSLIMLCVAALMILGVQSAEAVPFTFGDSVNHWEGWGNGLDDGDDTLGRPNLLGGGGTFDDVTGELTSLYINYEGRFSGIDLGDVFIDVNADKVWDFVIADIDGKQYPNGSYTSLNAYSVNIPLGSNPPGSPDYILSDVKYASSGISSYRELHPVEASDAAIDAGSDVGDFGLNWTEVSYWDFTLGKKVYEGKIDFNFLTGSGSGIVLDVSNPFTAIIGFAPDCANDVIYEDIDPIPEPSTVLLIGLGLVGLVAVGRKRVKK